MKRFLLILTSIFIISCQKKMEDLDVNLELNNSMIKTLYSEQWNGNYVYIKTAIKSFEEIKKVLQSTFQEYDYEYQENYHYSKNHSSSYIKGPNSSRDYRWQVEVISVDDEEAKDDLGSYLNIDLDKYRKETDKFLVILYDNNKKYNY